VHRAPDPPPPPSPPPLAAAAAESAEVAGAFIAAHDDGSAAYATLEVCWLYDLGKPPLNETITELAAMAELPRSAVTLSSEARVPMGDFDLNRWRLCHRLQAVPDPPQLARRLSQAQPRFSLLGGGSATLASIEVMPQLTAPPTTPPTVAPRYVDK
jgi:hypothetical protein